MYQSKYRHENCSPNLVPVAKYPGSGLPPARLITVSYYDTITHQNMLTQKRFQCMPWRNLIIRLYYCAWQCHILLNNWSVNISAFKSFVWCLSSFWVVLVGAELAGAFFSYFFINTMLEFMMIMSCRFFPPKSSTLKISFINLFYYFLLQFYFTKNKSIGSCTK